MKRLAFALALCVGFITAALGDTITLKDGTKLEGTIVEQKADEVVFEHSVGGAKTKSTFKKADVKSLEFGDAKPDAKAGETKGADKPAEKKPEANDYGELKNYKHEVIFVLDRSGSMAIADRFKTALDEIDKILTQLPAGTSFGVYLFDTKAVSVFDTNSIKTKDPQRQQLRKRIEALGGLDRSAFTDLAAALPPAIRCRPDAIYLLSDGVPTRGELEAEKIVKSIKDIMPTKKFPIHVTAIRGGQHIEGLEENDAVARAILKKIATATGGVYREVESKPEEKEALKKATPVDDQVELRFFHRNNEFKQRELRFPGFEVEVRDALFTNGTAVIEYANVSLELVTKTDAGVKFDEVKDLPLDFRQMDAEKRGVFGLGGTLAECPKTFWSHPIKVVRPQDDREDDNGATSFVKIPTDGGTLEVIYHRGKKVWSKTFSIKVPLKEAILPGPAGK